MEKRLAIYLRDDFRCVYCDRALKDAAPADVTLDHLVPRSLGGSNDATNLVTCCKFCNSARRDGAWHLYAAPTQVALILRRVREPLNLALARAIIAGEGNDGDL